MPKSSWPNFVFEVMGQFYTKKDTIKSLRRIDLEFLPRDNTLYCIVRAQAQCLISRIGVISPEARVAAQRREVAGRLERELREERQAQWMASLRGPGWARRGRFHRFLTQSTQNSQLLCYVFNVQKKHFKYEIK